MHSSKQVIAIAQATIHPEDREVLALEYFLRQFTGQEGEVLYGLRVDKRNTEGVLLQREETSAITGSLEEATALAMLFAKGTVPPCTLLEMVDEWHDLDLPPCEHATGEAQIVMSF